jgi:GT2 family glycosyltransferase
VGRNGLPHVDIVVLNWHGRSDTLVCLRSLAALSYPNHSVILIDNGCQEFSDDELRGLLPGARYVRTEHNRGFAGGANLGIQRALEAGAGYVLLLNNDATAAPDALTEMTRVAEADSAIGVVGAKLLQMDDPARLETVGVRVDLRWGRLFETGFGEEDRGQYDQISEVTAVSGGAMLLRRALCERLGGFDEGYFAYLEDVELCLRARRAGFRVQLAPRARVHHKGKGSSAGAQSTLSLYYATRNHLMLMDAYGVGPPLQRRLRQTVILTLNLAYALRGAWAARPARLRAVLQGARDYRRGVVGAAGASPS